MTRRIREPSTPGEILLKEFIQPHNLLIDQVASSIGVHRNSVSALVNGRRQVSTEMALRLSKFFGTTAEFWTNLQTQHNLWVALQDTSLNQSLKRIRKYG